MTASIQPSCQHKGDLNETIAHHVGGYMFWLLHMHWIVYLFLMYRPQNKMNIDVHIMFYLQIEIKIIIYISFIGKVSRIYHVWW